MNKFTKVILLGCLVLAPLIFYKCFDTSAPPSRPHILLRNQDALSFVKPQVALIFDDLGENVKDLNNIYALGIPLTIAVIPDLKFSKNVAHIGYSCGYSVLIHIPMEPKEPPKGFVKIKDKFIGTHLTTGETKRLLRHYLNYVRIAIGVNNHMGSGVTEDKELMRLILEEVQKRDLIFIDSHTSGDSISCQVAQELGTPCHESSGFLDALDDPAHIKEKLYALIELAREKEKIIIIAHPDQTTLEVLAEELPLLKEQVEFVTLKNYLGL
jgi:polysaccharide deacetylase 2 family uncharacterized protein YibQ